MRQTIKIRDELQLTDFMNTTNNFSGHINASKDSIMVDAKSVLGIASLGFGVEFDIELITVSEDEMVKFMNEMRRFRV